MSSLSPRAFSPVAFSLGLLLVLATAFPTPAPLGEEATDAAAPTLPPVTSPERTEDLIKYILGKISLLKKELCGKYGKCENVKEALAENSLNLPKMANGVECFPSRFDQEPCLIRITSGLLEFQIYLEYLQKVFDGDKKNAMDVHDNTKNLVQLLKQNVKNPDEVTTPDPSHSANVLSWLQSQSQKNWLQSTTFHMMLQSLEDFLQFSLRAVRIM
ncbi:interleukin-6 [Sorex araneus]|uniref:interleukin-6 n=1 Tax=Sorex araneus TaxID=42254 RepID=UPI00033195EF|nr:interleukin-6 [Sorex araneus]